MTDPNLTSPEAVAWMLKRLRRMPTYSGDEKGPHWTPDKAADMLEALAARVAELEAYKTADARIIAKTADDAVTWKTRAEKAEAHLAARDAENAKLRAPIAELSAVLHEAARNRDLSEVELRFMNWLDAALQGETT